jgi:hypothetical protein
MVKGDPSNELIYTNEDTFWSGGSLDRLNQDGLRSLGRVQQLLLQNDVKLARPNWKPTWV